MLLYGGLTVKQKMSLVETAPELHSQLYLSLITLKQQKKC
jgi:hypothetical protein